MKFKAQIIRAHVHFRLYTFLLLLLSVNLYVRGIGLTLSDSILNPGVMLVAPPMALILALWFIYSSTVALPQSQKVKTEMISCPDSLKLTSQQKTIFFYDVYFFLGLSLFCFGTFQTWQSDRAQILFNIDESVFLWRDLGFIFEGLGLFFFWVTWSGYFSQRQGNHRNDVQASFLSRVQSRNLHYPLVLSLYGLPWEALLRHYDQSLQTLSTDLAVYLLDLLDLLIRCFGSSVMAVQYWDQITIYSTRFYLIINETCAGVNLLISMSLYALGFSWVMNLSLKRAVLLIAYILPLSVCFNGFRIAIIFCLGHFGDQALATGAWHEGSAYLAQALLFIVLALVHLGLGPEQKCAVHDPSK